MVFPMPHSNARKASYELVSGYGVDIMTGCFMHDDPTETLLGWLRCGYTDVIATHDLTAGVTNLWHPIGQKTGAATSLSTLWNANTAPMNVDSNWTVLAAVDTNDTWFKVFGATEGMDDPYYQQECFTNMTADPPPLVAICEGVEVSGSETNGRVAVCGINGIYSDFWCGDVSPLVDGIFTGDALEGQPSHLNGLLTNIVNWLGEVSMSTGRVTITESDTNSFAIEQFEWADFLDGDTDPSLSANPDQFRGIIGVRSTYSGGDATVAEYAAMATNLGLQYLVFLEDYASLTTSQFTNFLADCDTYSTETLILIPGIKIQSELDVWYFGFRKGITLPQSGWLEADKILHAYDADTNFVGGQYAWVTANGSRYKMAHGNFRLDEKLPNGIPPENYNFHCPFISIYTYTNGVLADTMLDTYQKCAARTEWVSPMAIHLIDSTNELKQAWTNGSFKTIYQFPASEGLDGFTDDIGDNTVMSPMTYVSSGPRIDEWRGSARGFSGEWYDWARYRWFIKLAASSDVGLKDIRVMDGQEEIRRFDPDGATSFEHTLMLTHHDMQNLILIVTDNDDRQAISDELWDYNTLMYLNWCSDRNNMLGTAILPAPKAMNGIGGSTHGNYAAPVSMEKSGFRESLFPYVNQDISRLPHFDGQPYRAASASPQLSVVTTNGTVGGKAVARDIGRDLCSPDVAIQAAGLRLLYDQDNMRVPYNSKPNPWQKGPLVTNDLYEADLRYITFSHAGHLPAPVILEGSIRFKKDVTLAASGTLFPVNVLRINSGSAYDDYGYVAVQHSDTADNLVTNVDYSTAGSTWAVKGTLDPGAYAYFYPAPFGSVGVMGLDTNLSFNIRRYSLASGHFYDVNVGVDVWGESFEEGDTLDYRVMVFITGSDTPSTTNLPGALAFPEALRDELGLDGSNTVSYTVNAEQGAISDQQYILTIDGEGEGFAGEITMPSNFPASLPIIVTNLNGRWTSVLYDRDEDKFRPLGMHDNKAYCHRSPMEFAGEHDRDGAIFIGHPFTADDTNLWLNLTQVREWKLNLEVHNPTDQVITSTVSRSSYFTYATCGDAELVVPAYGAVDHPVYAEAISPTNFYATAYWTNDAGGVFHVEGNWDPGVPMTNGSAWFTNDASYTVTWPYAARNANVVFDSGSVTQSLDLQGTTWVITNQLVVGKSASSAVHMYPENGAIILTNAAGTAELVFREDSSSDAQLRMYQDDSEIIADRIVATNGGFQWSLFGGALTTKHGVTLGGSSFLIGQAYYGAARDATWNIVGGTNVITFDDVNDKIILAYNNDLAGHGTLNISGPDTELNHNGRMYIGENAGTALMVISNGATLSNSGPNVSYMGRIYNPSKNAGTTNTVIVTGNNSLWEMTGGTTAGILIGHEAPTTDQVIVSDGGQISIPNGSIYLGQGTVANPGGNNSILVTGADSLLDVGDVFIISRDYGGGQATSNNTVTVSDGGTMKVFDDLIVGDEPASSGNAVTVSNGCLYVTNAANDSLLDVPNGTLTVEGANGEVVADVMSVTNSSTFTFVAGSNGVTAVTVDGTLTLDSNATLEVDIADYDNANGLELVLVDYGSKVGEFVGNNITITGGYGRIEQDRDNRITLMINPCPGTLYEFVQVRR